MKNLKKMSRQELKSIHGGEENNGCYYNFKHYE
ncbi:bacteriocin-like protein [Elizabethkingia meningoseptica]